MRRRVQRCVQSILYRVSGSRQDQTAEQWLLYSTSIHLHDLLCHGHRSERAPIAAIVALISSHLILSNLGRLHSGNYLIRYRPRCVLPLLPDDGVIDCMSRK